MTHAEPRKARRAPGPALPEISVPGLPGALLAPAAGHRLVLLPAPRVSKAQWKAAWPSLQDQSYERRAALETSPRRSRVPTAAHPWTVWTTPHDGPRALDRASACCLTRARLKVLSGGWAVRAISSFSLLDPHGDRSLRTPDGAAQTTARRTALSYAERRERATPRRLQNTLRQGSKQRSNPTERRPREPTHGESAWARTGQSARERSRSGAARGSL